MIKVQLTNEEGEQCTVFFEDCASVDEPTEPLFSIPSMQFPYDAIANEYGHMPSGKEIAPDDFMFKARMFGFDTEII